MRVVGRRGKEGRLGVWMRLEGNLWGTRGYPRETCGGPRTSGGFVGAGVE